MPEHIKTGKQGETGAEISKFEPSLDPMHISRQINLPHVYLKDRIIAMVRDPWWIFVYWEITAQKEKEVQDEIIRHGRHIEKSIIRIYDITGIQGFNGKNAASFFDITLGGMARNWYIEVKPNNRWCVDIGIMTEEGDFYTLARSNIISTPRFGMSSVLDKEWMVLEEEYLQIFGSSCSLDVVGKSSMEIKRLLKVRIEQWISSGGITTLASHTFKKGS